ncbi:Rne/Rng family ribonuclease [Paenibacillus sp. y28]|uniref:Rne/Rng family ribonuclease n=1 Tax=Paenibacillus sp. y28 TaxID=3129110 RepID=UPI0030172448
MKRIIIEQKRDKLMFAMLEESLLTEFYMEQPQKKQLVGNIYKAKVMNVLPGMQAAFVSIGHEKNAFLYIDDVLPAHLEKVPKIKPSIRDLLREGQEIVVQVAKDPMESKGARVTTHYSLPGRWLVYMPNADYVAVSKKIVSDSEQERLKRIGEQIRQPGEGLIVRTVAEVANLEALEEDLNALREVWQTMLQRVPGSKAPQLLHAEQSLAQRLLRDTLTDQIEEVWLSKSLDIERLQHYVGSLSPLLEKRLNVFPENISKMREFGVPEELERAYRNKIRLSSGGFLRVDRTEALTVIDVNTGKYTGSTGLDDTVFETNLEAASAIAWLLRLRDIGGIVIIDFIDMAKEEHRQAVTGRLLEAAKSDRTRLQIVGWTRLGLLEMTRMKVRANLDAVMLEHCSACGSQSAKAPELSSWFV